MDSLPNQSLKLTARDHALLLALVRKVRLFSLRQIAGHWWDGELANTRRRLRALTESGLLRRITVASRSLPEFHEPIVSWRPGESAPEFAAAAYQCQNRWRRRPVRPVTAFIASERASQLFGGRGRGELKNETQATHDLGLAAVWIKFDQQASEWADAWQSEDLLAHTRRGEKLPDAFIVNDEGTPVWVIEFGGAYDTARVRDFHEDCDDRGLPYQIW